ncbi:MAG: hypothetical protein AB7U35_11810 [Sphingobium sp.]
MNPLEMVVLIVAIVMIARVVIARQKNQGPEGFADDPEVRRMRGEIDSLKDRVAVLERLATDNTSDLEREIEKLRDRG